MSAGTHQPENKPIDQCSSGEIIDALEHTILLAIAQKSATQDAIGYVALFEIAKAINRLADAQKPVTATNKGAVSFSIANFEDQPDGQTAQLREVASKRERDSGAS